MAGQDVNKALLDTQLLHLLTYLRGDVKQGDACEQAGGRGEGRGAMSTGTSMTRYVYWLWMINNAVMCELKHYWLSEPLFDYAIVKRKG